MIQVRRCAVMLFLLMLSIGRVSIAFAGFDLTFNVDSGFTPTQRANLDIAISYAETLWEGIVTGYQPGISVSGVEITIVPDSSIGLADALITNPRTVQAGFELTTTGRIRVRPDAINYWSSWDGMGPTPPSTEYVGVNFLDDVMAHEVGHLIGVGSQWANNGVYVNGSGKYTGEYGLAAFREEFDPTATFIPVELAGGPGRADFHWDQVVRSSSEEGNPADPWSLDPRLGIVDAQGRDFAFDLLTATFDPDYGEPFLSRTTIQSLRDVGFTVVPEPGTTTLLFVGAMLFELAGKRRRL